MAGRWRKTGAGPPSAGLSGDFASGGQGERPLASPLSPLRGGDETERKIEAGKEGVCGECGQCFDPLGIQDPSRLRRDCRVTSPPAGKGSAPLHPLYRPCGAAGLREGAKRERKAYVGRECNQWFAPLGIQERSRLRRDCRVISPPAGKGSASLHPHYRPSGAAAGLEDAAILRRGGGCGG
jgi:hypothetical protein